MPGTNSVSGLVSGLDTQNIVDQLIEIESYPLKLLQAKKELEQQKKEAWRTIQTKLLTFKLNAYALARTNLYKTKTVSSSDTSILTASASTSAKIGTYSLLVKQIATTHQSISAGFVDSDTAIGSGSLTIKMGGYIDKKTPLAFINNQSGFSRGSIKITDKAGNKATIDLSRAITVQDIIDTINENNTVQVEASVEGDHLVITDTSGGSGNFIIEEVSGGSSASSLGILGSTSGTTITGSDINNIVSTTALELLNENTGVRRYASGADIRITARDGSTFDVDISDADTVQDILDAINNASGNAGKVTISIDTDGNRFKITDNTGGTGNLTIQSLNSSYTAEDLGINGSVASSSLTGKAVIAGLNDVLLNRFNGGDGVDLGSFIIQDRAGNTATIDISSAETLQDVLDAINSASAISVTASINSSYTGIKLTDTSGGTGTLSVTEAGGTTASDLGILGSTSSSTLEGSDVNLQFISRYTRLDSLNGGTGVTKGTIKITDRAGNSASISLNGSSIETIGDVIDAINNASGISVKARINDTGSGIVVIDLTGEEENVLRIEDLNNGRMTKDLNIYGSTSAEQKKHGDDLSYITTSTLLSRLNDGLGVASGYIKITDRDGNSATIDLTSATTIQDVLNAINSASINVTATIDSTTGNAINLVDSSTGAGAFKVEELGSTTAEDLGILQADGVNSSTISGKDILSDVNDRQLDLLNGLSGVSGSWFTITNKSGYTATIDISSARTIQDVIQTINGNTALQVTASFTSNGQGIKLTDTSGGTGTLSVSDGNGAAASLGINVTASGSTINGNDILYLTGSSSLQVVGDGKGVDNASGLDDIRIIARDGTTIDVNIDSASTIQDVIDAINNDADNGGKITASLSSDGLRLVITDNTGSTANNLSVQSINSTTTAEDLGIATSVATSSVTGEELISIFGDRLLTALNDFSGITTGTFTITDRSGATATVSVTSSDRSLADVVSAINSVSIGVEAEIGSDGKGIIIKDTTGEEGRLYIEDNTVSQSLGIEETTGVSNTSYDGAFSWTITIDDNDDLEDIADAINDADVSDRFSAFVLNDGTGVNPYKLVINSKFSGTRGRLLITSTNSNLSFTESITAKDALVLVGGESGTPIVSSSNEVKNAIQGLTLNLYTASDELVSVKVEQDTEEPLSTIKTFIDTYNDIIDYISELMSYDPETGESGVLLGSVSLMNLQNELFSMVTDYVEGLPSSMNHISAVGISFNSDGHLEIDESKFEEKLLDDPDAVANLFNYEVNMALGDNGGSATASSTATGYSPSRVINGNTSEDEFGANSNGWMNGVQNESGAYLEIDFTRRISLYKIKVFAPSTSGEKLTGYTLQYWYNNQWNDYRTVSGNTQSEILHFFTLPYYTDKIRFNNIEGEDGYARVIEVQATEARGVGLRVNGRLSYLTDPEVGLINGELDNIEDNIDVYDYQIENMQERLEKRRNYLYNQFNRMEQLMGQMNAMSAWLASQAQQMK